MATTHIPPEDIALNEVLKHIKIEFNAAINGKELSLELDEQKIINSLSLIAERYQDVYRAYTLDKKFNLDKIDRINVRIGNYSFSACEEFEIHSIIKSKGWFIK